MLLGGMDDIAFPALCDAVIRGMQPHKWRTATYPNARHGFDMRGLGDRAGPAIWVTRLQCGGGHGILVRCDRFSEEGLSVKLVLLFRNSVPISCRWKPHPRFVEIGNPAMCCPQFNRRTFPLRRGSSVRVMVGFGRSSFNANPPHRDRHGVPDTQIGASALGVDISEGSHGSAIR